MKFQKILIKFFWVLIFVAMSIQAAESSDTSVLRSIATNVVTTGAGPDGCWLEEKDSPCSQIHVLNYANQQIISAFRADVMLLNLPEATKKLEAGDCLWLRFLANKLRDYEKVHKQNIELMCMCNEDVPGWPKEWVTAKPVKRGEPDYWLPVIKQEHLADFSTSYEPIILDLYDRVVTIQGQQKIAVALSDRILPNEVSLRQEWQAQLARSKQFADVGISPAERLVRTVKFRSRAALAVLSGTEHVTNYRPAATRRSATPPPSAGRLLADYDPVGDEFGGHSALGYKYKEEDLR
jgi:hypothetical protein